MHEQNETTKEIWAHQQHYVPQISPIPVSSKTFVCDDEPADEEYDPEKYAEEGDEVLGSDSDESGCESDGAVVASDGES